MQDKLSASASLSIVGSVAAIVALVGFFRPIDSTIRYSAAAIALIAWRASDRLVEEVRSDSPQYLVFKKALEQKNEQ